MINILSVYFTPILIGAATMSIIVYFVTRFFCHRKRAYLLDNTNLLATETLKDIIESVPDMIFLLNKDHKITQLLSPDINRPAISTKELIGKSVYESIDQECIAELKEIIDKTFSCNEIQKAHYTATFNESKRYFEAYFKQIKKGYVTCHERDITKVRLHEEGLIQAKEDIEKAQSINQLILEHSNCGLIYIDNKYVVQFENLHSAFKDGFPLNYKKNSFCYERVKNRNSPCENCIAVKALKTGSIQQEELKINDSLILEVTASPIINPNSSNSGFVLKYENVTVQDNIRKELLRAKEVAELSDRLKSQFLSNMSHEIRTPLNAIVGFSDLLVHADDVEEKEEYMSIIKRNNELLLQLINDILDLSRIESDNMEFMYKDVDINELFNALEAAGNLRLTENESVKIVFNSFVERCIIHTEENRIQQVLSNFLNNAIKFTQRGTIEMGYQIREEDIYFYVSDTGKGIPEERQTEVFKRFVKLNDFVHGTGLGLSICQTIIQKLGGEIGVKSTEGVGSTFWFTIPGKPVNSLLIHPTQPTPQKSKSQIPAENNHTTTKDDTEKTILIAEDEADNYILYDTLLRDKYTLLHAWNGVEALDLLHKNRSKIGAIIMDIKMPEMNGYEAVEKIRKQDRHIPVIAASAYALSEDVSKILKSGFTAYISKPLNKKELFKILDSVL